MSEPSDTAMPQSMRGDDALLQKSLVADFMTICRKNITYATLDLTSKVLADAQLKRDVVVDIMSTGGKNVTSEALQRVMDIFEHDNTSVQTAMEKFCIDEQVSKSASLIGGGATDMILKRFVLFDVINTGGENVSLEALERVTEIFEEPAIEGGISQTSGLPADTDCQDSQLKREVVFDVMKTGGRNVCLEALERITEIFKSTDVDERATQEDSGSDGVICTKNEGDSICISSENTMLRQDEVTHVVETERTKVDWKAFQKFQKIISTLGTKPVKHKHKRMEAFGDETFGGTTIDSQPVAKRQRRDHSVISTTKGSTSKNSTAAVQRSFDQFLNFSKLPAELRILIWKCAMSEPRSTYIHMDGKEEEDPASSGSQPQWRRVLLCTVSATDIVPVFRACRESWQIAQGMSKPLAFDRSDQKIGPLMQPFIIRGSGQHKLVHNSERDQIFIGPAAAYYVDEVLGRIQSQEPKHVGLLLNEYYDTELMFHVFRALERCRTRLASVSFFFERQELTGFRTRNPYKISGCPVDSNLADDVHFYKEISPNDGQRIFWAYKYALCRYALDIKLQIASFKKRFPAWKTLNNDVYLFIRHPLPLHGTRSALSCEPTPMLCDRYDGLSTLFEED